MDRTRVRLRLLVGDEEVQDYLFPVQGAAQIVQGEDEIPIIRPLDEDSKRAHDVIARFKCSGPSITLEPFAAAFVDAPTTRPSTTAPDVSPVCIQASVHLRQQFIFLRPQDTINFRNRDLKVEVAFVEGLSSLPQPASTIADPAVIDNDDGDAVQVKSSNAEPDISVVNDDAIEPEINHEDDTSLMPDLANGAFSNTIDTTPAKARSGETAITETPRRRNDNSHDEDTQLYSTAPNKAPDDDIFSNTERNSGDRMASATESPSPVEQPNTVSHRLDLDENTSRSETPSEIQLSNGTLRPPANNLTEHDEFSPGNRVAITYGKRRRTGTPRVVKQNETPKVKEKLPETDARTSNVLDLDANEQNDNADEANALTSEIDNLHGFAREAAERTMPKTSGKRKSSEHEESLEEELKSSTKKQRTETPSSKSSAEDEEMQLYDPPESDGEGTRPPQSKKSRRKSAQKSTRNSTRKSTRKSTIISGSTQESGEEIVVAARRASPEVVIHNSRQDDALVSSHTSSNIASETPRILLSSDSTSNNSAAKKWLKSIGATVIGSVPSRRSYFVCVVPKEHSLKSAKVLHTLVKGQLVVTDSWLEESEAAQELKDPNDYVHKSLKKTIEKERSHLFSGKKLYFTEALMKNYNQGWKDIQDVAKAAGADEVDRVPFHLASFLCDREDVIFFGNQKNDTGSSSLMKEYGCTVFSKDFFTDTIIAGSLDRHKDDHKLTVGGLGHGKRGRLS